MSYAHRIVRKLELYTSHYNSLNNINMWARLGRRDFRTIKQVQRLVKVIKKKFRWTYYLDVFMFMYCNIKYRKKLFAKIFGITVKEIERRKRFLTSFTTSSEIRLPNDWKGWNSTARIISRHKIKYEYINYRKDPYKFDAEYALKNSILNEDWSTLDDCFNVILPSASGINSQSKNLVERFERTTTKLKIYREKLNNCIQFYEDLSKGVKALQGTITYKEGSYV